MPTMPTSLLSRVVFALVCYLSASWVLYSLHDYPHFRKQLDLMRQHDEVAEARPWLQFFYFINEAGSGIKFFFTRDEKHMSHYPSASHIVAHRRRLAESGDWEMQMSLAQMYFQGEWVPFNKAESLRWLEMARQHAPARHRTEIDNIIAAVRADTPARF